MLCRQVLRLVLLVLADAAYPDLPGAFSVASRDGSLFGRGFDPRDPFSKCSISFRILLNFIPPPAVKSSVIDLHFSNSAYNHNEYADPVSGHQYAQPDELHVFDVPASQFEMSKHTFTNYSDYRAWDKSYHFTAIVNPFIVPFVDVDVDVTSYMQELTKNSTKTISLRQQYATLRVHRMHANAILKHRMQSGQNQNQSAVALAQQRLPHERSTAAGAEAYNDFLLQFGPFWVNEAVHGGSLDILVITNSSIVADLGYQYDVNVNILVAKIWVLLGAIGSASAEASGSLDVRFVQHTEIAFVVYGGDPTAFLTGNYKAWLESIRTNPAPLNVTYQNISTLIVDETKAALMEAAAAEYLHKGAIIKGSVMDACGTPPGMVSRSASTLLEEHRHQQMARKTGVERRTDPIPLSINSTVGLGYDVKLGQHVSTLWNHSFSEARQWEDPVSGHVYALPDGVEVSLTPSACLRMEETVVANISAAVEAYAHLTLGAGALLLGAFDWAALFLNGGFAHVRADASADLQAGALFQVKAAVGAELLTLSHRTNLPAALRGDLLALPQSYSPAYPQLVKKWGTHYVGSQSFGGGIEIGFAFDAALKTSLGVEYVQGKTRWLFKLLLDVIIDVVEKKPLIDKQTLVKNLFNDLEFGAQTKLSVGLNGSLTSKTIHVVSTDGFPVNGVLLVDQEAIHFSSKTPNSFIGCSRGWPFGGLSPVLGKVHNVTRPDSHAAGVKIEFILEEEFAIHVTKPTIKVFGGNGKLIGSSVDDLQAGGLTSWLQSIKSNYQPGNATFRLSPITHLVVDPVKNTLVAQAVRDYIGSNSTSAQKGGGGVSRERSNAAPKEMVSQRTKVAPPKAGSGTNVRKLAPGICTGSGSSGIGCSVDATKLEAYALTVSSRAPVILMPSCKPSCWENVAEPCDPGPPDRACEGCILCPPPAVDDVPWRIPAPMSVTPRIVGESYQCYDNFTADKVEDYQQRIIDSHGWNMIVASHSKTTTDFYEQYYRNDTSLALIYKNLQWMSLVNE
jgi:hypothetical protein